MNIEIKLNQTTSLTPQMQQSMEILQMSLQELLEYINQLVEENPVVEIEENYDELDRNEVLKRKLEWLDSIDEQNRVYHNQNEEEHPEQVMDISGYEDADEEDLNHHLLSQLDFLKVDADIRRAAEHLIEYIDEKGYLEADINEIANEINSTVEKVEEALKHIQSLEPAGIGARDLKECLRIQLDRKGIKDETPYRIVDGYLEILSKNHLDVIAKRLEVSLNDVKYAYNIIKKLNPRPGSVFDSGRQPQYLTPDLTVVKFRDYYEILLNDYLYPRLSISRYYRDVISSTASNEVKGYISGKLKEAAWIIKCFEQRNDTLTRVAKTIVDIQIKFFDAGPRHLVPMILKTVADKLGIHESTVSRAIRGKYLQCSWGIYSLDYFFSRGLSAGGDIRVAPENIKKLIKDIIDDENKKKPYSDQQITDILNCKGIEISRRTVAKYRDELSIAGASTRKEY